MLSFFVDFSNLFLCHFYFTIAFWGEFKSLNSRGIVYPYLSTAIGKPFLVSIFYFCFLPIMSTSHKFFELSLATTITVLKPYLLMSSEYFFYIFSYLFVVRFFFVFCLVQDFTSVFLWMKGIESVLSL